MIPKRLHSAFCVLALAVLAVGVVLTGPVRAQQRLREPLVQRELPMAYAPAPELPPPELPPVVDGMAALTRQPELLEKALAGLKASPNMAGAGRPQLYFVSFAGWASQAVFKREAFAVRDLFDAKFGTKDRSLVLVNHASTIAETPLATSTNLDKALQRIGGLMQDDDVLFLFLTSHGNKDLFAVELPGDLPRDDLTPPVLKGMLDRSGIKHRVIVLSACHSGSFIPTLADASTLVIAAADAERTSFGCEDRREWTYFGDAFFNRALRKDERSFERAFARAKRTIARWETEQRLLPSLPQIGGGQALRGLLDAIARTVSDPPGLTPQ